jgi:hypothetical protein
MTDLDVGLWPREGVAAVIAFPALDKACVAQLAENGVQELIKDVVGCRDLVDESKVAGRQPSDVCKRLEALLAPFCKHGIHIGLSIDGNRPSALSPVRPARRGQPVIAI